MSIFSSKTYNQLAGQKVQRIEALSDGVFAVALTLLVLDIKVPLQEAIHTEASLITAFCQLTPRFLTYFMSFMTLGIFWTGHSMQFQYIEKSNRNLNWISLFFLLFISVLPFTTAFTSEHITFRFSVVLYWSNIFALGAILYLHWNYAYKHGFTSLDTKEAISIHRAINQRIVFAQTLYAAGAALCFINTYLSITVIILIQLNYALGIISGKKATATL